MFTTEGKQHVSNPNIQVDTIVFVSNVETETIRTLFPSPDEDNYDNYYKNLPLEELLKLDENILHCIVDLEVLMRIERSNSDLLSPTQKHMLQRFREHPKAIRDVSVQDFLSLLATCDQDIIVVSRDGYYASRKFKKAFPDTNELAVVRSLTIEDCREIQTSSEANRFSNQIFVFTKKIPQDGQLKRLEIRAKLDQDKADGEIYVLIALYLPEDETVVREQT